MRAHFNLMVVLLLSSSSVSMSGCTATDRPNGAVQGVQVYREFSARYVSGNASISLALTGREPVMDRDSTVRQAYHLTIRPTGTNLANKDFFLDGGFRIVREDAPLGSKATPLAGLWWTMQGTLAPFGLNFLRDFATGSTPAVVYGVPYVVAASRTETSTGVTLVIATPMPTSPRFLDWGGTYDFNSTGPLPTRITDSDGLGSGVWFLDQFGWGDPLEPADEWPSAILPDSGLHAPGATTMFPGAEADLLGYGASPQEALAKLFEQQPATRAVLEAGGCIGRTGIQPGAESTIGPGLVSTRSVKFSFLLLDSSDAQQAWDVEFERTSLTNATDKWTTSPAADRFPQASCTALARMPPTTVDARAFVQKARSLEELAGRHVRGFSYQALYAPPRFGGIYEADFETDGAPGAISSLNYVIEQSAAQGTWFAWDVPQVVKDYVDSHGLP